MTSNAKSPTIADLERQEAELVLPDFTMETACRLGLALHDAARRQAAPLVIDIRSSDRTYFHMALPGSIPDNDDWARRKGNVVLRKQESSLLVGRRLEAANDTVGLHLGMDPRDYAAHGGAFPVRVANCGVVAVIAVSGLPSVEDHDLIVRVLREHLKASSPN